MKGWLEVSLTVEQELAEAVADVFARFAPNGVTTEQGVTFQSDEDEGRGAGPVIVRAYLPHDSALQETRRQLEDALGHLNLIRRLPSPTYQRIEERNWMEAWKARYRPILVGKRLVVVPAWLEPDAAGRIAIRIDPGMAFGTGTHPSTQLCLEQLEQEIEHRRADVRPFGVIDVGCGSGILAIAALRLGAEHALGLDIDAKSLDNARLNGELNGVSDRLTLVHGSVTEILAGRFVAVSSEVVLANILAATLIRLLEEGLAEIVARPGALILGGILAEHRDDVLRAAAARGLSLSRESALGDWVSLTFAR